MSTWQAPRRALTIWRGSGLLGSFFGLFVGANAAAVLWIPTELGYPGGGGFLLDVLPLFSLAAWSGAVLAGPVVLVRRARVGLGACATFCGALGALGAADAYLWWLCVVSA